MSAIGREADIAAPAEQMAYYCAHGPNGRLSGISIKQTFDLRRKSGWIFNPQKQVTNLFMGLR